MADDWQPYLCRVNDELASIFVNLALRQAAPILEKPWLLWVWVYFQNGRRDGLSSSEEAPLLYRIEDALIASLSAKTGAVLPGRITTQGRREFYFYADTRDGAQQAVAEAMKQFPKYKYSSDEQHDPAWSQYLNVLYPSEDAIQKIENSKVLDALEKHGDIHAVPREVQHWAYFPSASSRTAFKTAAMNLGFVFGTDLDGRAENPYGICVSNHQSVDQNSIDSAVLTLVALCNEHGGDYDGWETQVVTQ